MKKILLCAVLLSVTPILMADPTVDQTAPLHLTVHLQFKAVDGTEVDMVNLRGKVVLIDFWATWCPPCRGEVPSVVAAYQKYHDQGFEVVGISLDKDKDKLLAYTKANGMVWPQYFDGHGWNNSISNRFGIHLIPTMWLVGKDGKLAATLGDEGGKDLDGQVAKLLQAPNPDDSQFTPGIKNGI